jgi:hypothetical protein
MTQLSSILEELLRERVTGALERERTEFDRLTTRFSPSIALFAARKLGQRALAGLRQLGIESCAFTDNNEAVWGELPSLPATAQPTCGGSGLLRRFRRSTLTHDTCIWTEYREVTINGRGSIWR